MINLPRVSSVESTNGSTRMVSEKRLAPASSFCYVSDLAELESAATSVVAGAR